MQTPQAQKNLDKTLLYPTNTAGFSNEAMIPTENSFYFPTENKSYSTTVFPVSCGSQPRGIAHQGLDVLRYWFMFRMAQGLLSHVRWSQLSRCCQRGGERPPLLWWAQTRGSRGPQGDRGASALGCLCSHLCSKTFRNRHGVKVSSCIWEIICCPGHITSSSAEHQKPVAFKPKVNVVPEFFLQLLIKEELSVKGRFCSYGERK